MHITYLNFASNKNMKNPDAYFKSTDLPHTIYEELARGPGETVSIVQRATYNSINKLEKVAYYFVKDEFDAKLRWWQEPVTVLEHLSGLKPDIIHIHGLNLPLQIRWLRREIGDKIKIVGEHTGETIWAYRNLWLQQFGLRVLDGFLFKNMEDAQYWIKTSVILEKQPVVEIALSTRNPETTAKSLLKFYNKLLAIK